MSNNKKHSSHSHHNHGDMDHSKHDHNEMEHHGGITIIMLVMTTVGMAGTIITTMEISRNSF